MKITKNLYNKLKDKLYRDSWVEQSVKMAVPYQIEAIREKRGWNQTRLAKEAGMQPNAVSRLESVEYGNFSVNTLLRLASAFDCGLLVRFVPFSRMVKEFEDVSAAALEVDEFEKEDMSKFVAFKPSNFSFTDIPTEQNSPLSFLSNENASLESAIHNISSQLVH